MMLHYDNFFETVTLTCPHCGSSTEIDYRAFLLVLNLHLGGQRCFDCGCDYAVTTICLTRVVEHRDEAVGEGADETPKFLSTED